MSGTDTISAEDKARQPSPFVAEIEARQRDIIEGRAEPWNAPIEERRANRRRDMEILRLVSMQSAVHMSEYIAGRLPGWKREVLEDIRDPLAALANLNRSIIQITLAEDRFDESAEDRIARIKAEAEAKAAAELKAQAERDYTARQIRRVETKRQVQGAVRAIALPSLLGLNIADREKLLGNLFRDLESGEAYDGDPAETVADLCVRMGIPRDKSANPAAPIDPLAQRARLIALARAHLAALQGPHALNAGENDPRGPTATAFTSSSRGQGPPN